MNTIMPINLKMTADQFGKRAEELSIKLDNEESVEATKNLGRMLRFQEESRWLVHYNAQILSRSDCGNWAYPSQQTKN